MLAYEKGYSEFCDDIHSGQIVNAIEIGTGRKYSPSEENSFNVSLGAVANALCNVSIPGDAQVGLEFKVPLTNKRIDFIIAGEDNQNRKNVVIVELKQWKEVKHTDMPDIVLLGKEQHVHPSWQAFSYGTTISNFNEYVETHPVNIYTCTFLHNYKPDYEQEIKNPIYKEGIQRAPAFINDEWVKFANFIGSKIQKKSSENLLYYLSNGRIKPSRYLVDTLKDTLNGNKAFELIDEQRVAFSNILKEINTCLSTKDHRRKVIIVKGGAGTGKSVIAVQLLGALHQKGRTAFYVAKSSYIKDSYHKMLTRNIPNFKVLRTLFRGSGDFYKEGMNGSKQFDVLIVDEAHRLTKQTKVSWFFRGNNQIQEIIHACKVAVFFIDETQQIDIKDYGTVENIRKAALMEDADVIDDKRFELHSQFRCNGSDDYIAWCESLLYNKKYEASGEPVDYDIRVFDDPEEMHKAIRRKNEQTDHPCRMLSGDVFPWISRDDKSKIDINIGDFHAQWNLKRTFAVDPDAIDEVGCIHTSQGMEFDYVGLIVGDDLLYRNGKVVTDYTRHPQKAGEFKRPHKQKVMPEDAPIIDRLIRNTYKVLFTRGQKGLYLYVMDSELKKHVLDKIKELQRFNKCKPEKSDKQNRK